MGWEQTFYVQNTAGTDFSGPITPPADTSGLDLIVICGRWEDANVPVVDDNKGNVWTPVGTPVGGRQVGIWWCQKPKAGTGHTFHMGNSWYMQIMVLGFKGSGSLPKDQHFGKTGTDPITVGVTTTEDGELAVSVCIANPGVTTTASAPFIVLQGDKTKHMATAYATQATKGPIAVTMSSSPGSSIPAMIASFKALAVPSVAVLTVTPCGPSTVAPGPSGVVLTMSTRCKEVGLGPVLTVIDG